MHVSEHATGVTLIKCLHSEGPFLLSNHLAAFLQRPTSFPWHLQRCCKRQPVFRGICNGVANVNQFSAAFATVLQTPTSFPWHLQQCCKRQPVFRGICNSVANVNQFSVAFATVLQTSQHIPSPTRHSSPPPPLIHHDFAIPI